MKHVLTAATAACIPFAIAAQQSTPEVITVTGRQIEQSLPQQIAEYGVQLDTLSREDVRNGSYVDVTQLLQMRSPGLFMLPKNGPFDYSDISLLGSRTDDVLWLVDGVRINNRLYSGTPPLDTMPSAMIDHTEVLQGGQALFYGTAATAGVVNIVTKPFSREAQSSLSLATDSNDSHHVDGYYSNTFGAEQVVFYGSIDKSDGYQAFRDQDFQPSSKQRKRGYDVQTIGAKYAHDFNDDIKLSLSYQNTDADLDYAQPFRVARDVNSRNENLATMKLDYALSDTVGFYLKGYYHKWHTTYDTFYTDLANPSHLITLYDNAFWGYDDRGLNAVLHFGQNKGVDYYVGYDYQRYGGRDEVLFIAPNKEKTQAVFAQIRAGSDRAKFSAGVRYNAPDVGETATVFTATGEYDFTNNLFIRGTAGTNFRLPTAEELFANDPGYERGNPNLKPERSKGVNVSLGGTRGRDKGFHWEVTAFMRNTDDLIDYGEFDTTTGQDVFANVEGTVKVRGALVAVGGSFTDSVSAELSYTHNKAENDGGGQIARIPKDLTKAVLDFHPAGSALGATIALNYVGDVSVGVNGVPTSYGKYTVIDLSGRYVFGEGKKQQLNLALQNALDEEYGRPSKGCLDVSTDGPYDCSSPYTYVNLGLPRTLRFSYTHGF
ncbi:MAG: TonB-dependent receptor [Gammaproteobacteria bacterium]